MPRDPESLIALVNATRGALRELTGLDNPEEKRLLLANRFARTESAKPKRSASMQTPPTVDHVWTEPRHCTDYDALTRQDTPESDSLRRTTVANGGYRGTGLIILHRCPTSSNLCDWRKAQ